MMPRHKFVVVAPIWHRYETWRILLNDNKKICNVTTIT